MSTRAEPVNVPRLKQKLAALYLSTRTLDDTELGRLFRSPEEPDGLTAKAIRHWIYGEAARPASHVPAARIERLVEIFRDRLPRPRPIEEVRALLLADTEQDISLALLAGAPGTDWMRRVLSAPVSTARIIPVEPTGEDLKVTARRRALESLQPQEALPVGQPFQLETPAGMSGWLCVVQWAHGGWFGLELDDSGVEQHLDGNICRLPRTEPCFEENEAGLRRYILLRAAQPFPADVVSLLSTSASALAPLDAGALLRLADVAGEPGTQMSALDVRFLDE